MRRPITTTYARECSAKCPRTTPSNVAKDLARIIIRTHARKRTWLCAPRWPLLAPRVLLRRIREVRTKQKGLFFGVVLKSQSIRGLPLVSCAFPFPFQYSLWHISCPWMVPKQAECRERSIQTDVLWSNRRTNARQSTSTLNRKADRLIPPPQHTRRNEQMPRGFDSLSRHLAIPG